MQLPQLFDYEGCGSQELNKLLPSDIRVMGKILFLLRVVLKMSLSDLCSI